GCGAGDAVKSAKKIDPRCYRTENREHTDECKKLERSHQLPSRIPRLSAPVAKPGDLGETTLVSIPWLLSTTMLAIAMLTAAPCPERELDSRSLRSGQNHASTPGSSAKWLAWRSTLSTDLVH